VSPEDRHFRHESTITADVRVVFQPERLGMANALVRIGRDCRISDGAVIRNAVLPRESSVARGTHIQGQAVS
jgi:acetyltransferase-like isoleucine patch superfamily enzyme